MTIEDNKATVTRFFGELLDKENVGILDDLFTEDCVFHRGDLTEPARGRRGIRSMSKSAFNSTATSGRQFIR